MNNTTKTELSTSQYSKIKRQLLKLYIWYFIFCAVFLLSIFQFSMRLTFTILINELVAIIMPVLITLAITYIRKNHRQFLIPASTACFLMTYHYYESCYYHMGKGLIFLKQCNDADTVSILLSFFTYFNTIYVIFLAWHLSSKVVKHFTIKF